MRALKKIFLSVLIGVFCLLLVTALACFHIEKMLSPTHNELQFSPYSPQILDSDISTYSHQLPINPWTTLHIEKIEFFQSTAKAVFTVKCSRGSGFQPIDIGHDCEDAYFQQIEYHGSIRQLRPVSLNDQKEKSWNINLQGDQFLFPFDSYTAIGHMGGILFFYLKESY